MNVTPFQVFMICARQELAVAARSRWVHIFAVVFAVLAVAVAGSGYVLSGGRGVQDLSRTAASLLQLVLLLAPLTSILVAVVALTPEAGAAQMLFSQPVDRRTVLAGRVAGVAAALVASQAIGCGAAGVVVFLQAGEVGATDFAAVLAAAVVLTVVFVSLGAALVAGRTADDRARGMALGVVTWFVAVLLFDILVLGLAAALPSGPASRVLIAGAIVNPVDAVRTGTLLVVDGTAAFGAASLAFLRVTGGAASAAVWLGLSILIWIAGPLAVATMRLRKADL